MGFGGRKPKFMSGMMDSLEDSALLQFQEITGLGTAGDYQAHNSSAGFGLGPINQESTFRNQEVTFNSSIGGVDISEAVKRGGAGLGSGVTGAAMETINEAETPVAR